MIFSVDAHQILCCFSVCITASMFCRSLIFQRPNFIYMLEIIHVCWFVSLRKSVKICPVQIHSILLQNFNTCYSVKKLVLFVFFPQWKRILSWPVGLEGRDDLGESVTVQEHHWLSPPWYVITLLFFDSLFFLVV